MTVQDSGSTVPAKPGTHLATVVAQLPAAHCVQWPGSIQRDGYGLFLNRSAARVVYERLVGAIPEGMQVDHLCRMKACVNPAHLEIVTPSENVRRQRRFQHRISEAKARLGLAAPRGAPLCLRGHPLTTENQTVRANGRVQCRTCRREDDRAYYWRKAAAK